jgi:hypothetical protein
MALGTIYGQIIGYGRRVLQYVVRWEYRTLQHTVRSNTFLLTQRSVVTQCEV